MDQFDDDFEMEDDFNEVDCDDDVLPNDLNYSGLGAHKQLQKPQ